MRPRLAAAGIVVTVVVVACFAGLFVTIRHQRSDSDWARHSEEVLASANQLERFVIDLQTGQRGYALTHEPRFLEPWRAALTRAPQETQNLRRLVSDNPEQERRATAIAVAIRSYMDFSKRAVFGPPLRNAAAVTARTSRDTQRIDAIRHIFDRFSTAEKALSETRQGAAAGAARTAVIVAGGGLAGALLLLAAFFAYLARVVVAPVRRLASAAVDVAAGQLDTRLPESGVGEVRELGRAFNRMTTALQQGRDELESQNSELEIQTAELEDQQQQLAEANDELLAQRSELEHALSELHVEQRIVGSFYEFAQSIAGLVDDARLAQAVLAGVGDFLDVPLALLYVGEDVAEGIFSLAAARGVDRSSVEATLRAGVGVAGRALLEARAITTAEPVTTLQLPSPVGTVTARHELHVPLVVAERVLGVIALGRVEDRPFSHEEIAAAEHLAGQAAGAYSNLLSFSAEQRLARINAAVLDATRDGIALLDESGTVVLANAAFDDLMTVHGVPRGIGLAEGVAVVRERVDDPDAYAAWIAQLRSETDREDTIEYRLRESGRSFVMYSSDLRAEPGAGASRLFVMRETTNEREAERLKTELVATVSHELRTPLASILGFAELLKVRDPDSETRRKYVDIIYKEGQRLTVLVNDFLDLQRIEQGRFELSRAPVDVAALLESEIELYGAQSEWHTFELRSDEGVTAIADRDRLTQVIGNLFSNAIKYSPEGGPVSVSVARRNGSVRVSVTDRGLGIPQDARSHIFERFFRVASEGRTIGGTGLGLAVCQEIIAAHGGEIGFDSVEGSGSTFWFEVPAANEGDE